VHRFIHLHPRNGGSKANDEGVHSGYKSGGREVAGAGEQNANGADGCNAGSSGVTFYGCKSQGFYLSGIYNLQIPVFHQYLCMKYMVLALFIFFTSFCCAQGDYKLEGKSISEFNGRTIYLLIRDIYTGKGKSWQSTDSAVIRNNSFSFSGKLVREAMWSSLYFKKGGHFYFIMDTGLNKVTIRELPKNSTTYKNKLSNSALENLGRNDRLYQQIENEHHNYYVKFGKPLPENNSILVLDPTKNLEFRNWYMHILRQNPTVYYSLVHLYKASWNLEIDPGLLEETFAALDTSLRSSVLGQELAANIARLKGLQVGNKIKHISAFRSDGSPFSTASLQGRPYLVIFGATWCKPCKDNYPFIKSIYTKYKSQNLEMVAINLDEKKDKWLEQIKSYQLEWINISELKTWAESKIAKDLNTSAKG
jgi:thiol-disulfide isomerase/thioredoxin